MTTTLAEKIQTFERIDVKTPHGGDYSITYFLDAKRNPVSKSLAVQIEVCEFKADGTMIHRTYLAK